jgi:hypothetical protein
VKIAVCTPYFAEVKAKYAYSLATMIAHTLRSEITFNGRVVVPEIEVMMRASSILPEVRNRLVEDALAWGSDYLLWIDADHSFPPDSLLRLLSHNLPVVGVNYPRRTEPTSPTVVGMNGGLIWTSEEMAKNREVTEVRFLGFGLCLMDARIFEVLNERALAEGKENFWPLFAFESVPGKKTPIGEDVVFYKKLEEAGISAYVDHDLSWAVEHFYEKALTNAHAAEQKAAYLATRPAPDQRKS